MGLIDVTLHEVEFTFSPKAVIFGSADETVQADPESETDTGAEFEWAPSERSPNLLGLLLFVFGIGLAVWLGRRRVSATRES